MRHVNLAVLPICKGTALGHRVRSHSCVTITTSHVPDAFIWQNLDSVPRECWLPSPLPRGPGSHSCPVSLKPTANTESLQNTIQPTTSWGREPRRSSCWHLLEPARQGLRVNVAGPFGSELGISNSNIQISHEQVPGLGPNPACLPLFVNKDFWEQYLPLVHSLSLGTSKPRQTRAP